MRYLMKRGRKIKLLPAALPEEEDTFCGKCVTNFDSAECRRACFYNCGHVACLSCIFKMENGCEDCAREQNISSDVIPIPIAISINSEDNISEIPVVLASPSKPINSSEKNDNVFPRNQSLSLSNLPILQCAPEPPTYDLDEEEEDEWEEQFVQEMALGKELEMQQQQQIEDDIPVIDLSVEEDIPVIDLSGDEEEQIITASVPALIIMTPPHENDNSEQIITRPQLTLPIEKVRKPSILDTPPTTPEEKKDSGEIFDDPKTPTETNEDLTTAPRSLRKRRKSQCFPSETGDLIGFGRYFCRYCNVSGFTDKASLGRHLCQEHWDIRPFPCTICDWPFDSQRNLDQHMLTHSNERSFKCSLCDTGYNRKYTLDKHLQKVHGVAPEKKRRRATKNKPSRPTSNNNDKPCLDFETSFEEEEAIPIPIPIPIPFHDEIDEDYTPIMHYSAPSGEVDDDTIEHTEQQDISKDFEVPPKKRKYIRQQEYPATVSSISNAENRFSCSHCPEIFSGKTRLGNHLREVHADKRPYTCDLCGWSFAQNNKLALHRITHTIDRPHKCKQCEATFNRKYSLERHVRIMHLKKPRISEAAENKPSQRKPASCKHCQKIFENKDELGIHLQQEHPEKRPHVCQQCKWSFSRRKHLVAHMRTHTHERPYSCGMCDAKFNRRFSLERHMEHVHRIRIRLTPEETPVGDEYCPECQSLFGTLDCQKVAYSECGHISCMECVIRAELGCGQCATELAPKSWPVEEIEKVEQQPKSPEMQTNSDFFQKQIQNQKTKLGEESNEFDKLIEKIHNTPEGLKPIKLKLQKVKTYSCKYCKQEFPEKWNLGVHLHNIHRDLRPFRCDICKWAFSSMRDLERHLVTHTKERPFNCETCSASFNRKSAMDRHLDRVHNKWKRI